MAAALMAKIRTAPVDRWLPELKSLELVSRLNLSPAHAQLIFEFFDTYLRPTADEMARIKAEPKKLNPDQQEKVMEILQSRPGLLILYILAHDSNWQLKSYDLFCAIRICMYTNRAAIVVCCAESIPVGIVAISGSRSVGTHLSDIRVLKGVRRLFISNPDWMIYLLPDLVSSKAEVGIR
jgi:hypothetical protein